MNWVEGLDADGEVRIMSAVILPVHMLGGQYGLPGRWTA